MTIRGFNQRWAWWSLLAVALVLVGCKKVKNPHGDSRAHRGWLLFNYYIPAGSIRDDDDLKTSAQRRFTGIRLRAMVWTNYFTGTLFEEFSERHGVAVDLLTVTNSIELRERLMKGEGVDVVLVSRFMLEQLIAEGRLAPLDRMQVPNLTNIVGHFRTNLYDPDGRYSAPYFWSTAGIAYNSRKIDRRPLHWRDLFSPSVAHREMLRGRITLGTGPQRTLQAALIGLGKDPNTRSAEHWEQAAEFVRTNAQLFHLRVATGAMTQELIDEQVLMSWASSADAIKAQAGNRYIRFTVPEEGSYLSLDHWAVVKDLEPERKLAAELFINYMLEPAVAARAVNQTFRATTVAAATPFVLPEIRRGASYMTPADPRKTFLLDYVPEVASIRERVWRELRGTNLLEHEIHVQ